MDSQDIFSSQRLHNIIKNFDENLAKVLTPDYLKKGEECVIDVLKSYDLAISKCFGNDIIDKIEKALLRSQEQLIPVIKRYFGGERFDVELDYVYFLLMKFRPDSLILIKDEWIEYVQRFRLDYEYFTDMVDTLFRNKVSSKSELIRITELEIERVTKEIKRLSSINVSDYVSFEIYLKQHVGLNKDDNPIQYINVFEEEWEKWKKKYWEKDNAINRLQSDKQYSEKLRCLVNKLKRY